MSRRCVRLLLLAGLTSSLALGCSDDSAHSHPDDGAAPQASVADVVFVGGATDEALVRLLSEEASEDASQALEFDVPTAGEVLDATSPVTFVWHGASSALGDPAEREQRSRAPSAWQRVLWDLKGLTRPLGVAHAHGAPFNGTGFFLVFASDNDPKLLRVFTSATSYTPDSDAWDLLTQAEGEIEVAVTSGVFEDNQLTSDGGPFVGGSTSFSLE